MPVRRRRSPSFRSSPGAAIEDAASPSTDGTSGENNANINVLERSESLDRHLDAVPPQPRPAAEPPRGSPETTLLGTTSSSTLPSATASGEAADVRRQAIQTLPRRETFSATDPDTRVVVFGGASNAGDSWSRPNAVGPPPSSTPARDRGITLSPPQLSNLQQQLFRRGPPSPPPLPPTRRLVRGAVHTRGSYNVPLPAAPEGDSLSSALEGEGGPLRRRNSASPLLVRLAEVSAGIDPDRNNAGVPRGGGVGPPSIFGNMTLADSFGGPRSAPATAAAAANGRNRPAARLRRAAAAPSGSEPAGPPTGGHRRNFTEATGVGSIVDHSDGNSSQSGATGGAAGGGVSSAAGEGTSGTGSTSNGEGGGAGRGAGGVAGTVAAANRGASSVGRGVGEPTTASTTIHQLHKASVVGDLTAISRFIEDGGNLEAQSFCGRTALHYAAFYGHADVARALILAGANVCSRGGGNSTPLHFAAWGGNKRVVRLLLEYGADVEARDTEGNTPQAYSEDDELYEMLMRARRRLFPLPSSLLSGAMEQRPLAAVVAYSVLLVICVYTTAALVVTWTSAAAGETPVVASTSASDAAGSLSSSGITWGSWLLGFLGMGGKAATAAGAAGAKASSGGAGEGVPSLVFWTALPVALLAGLAPAVALAIGFKRKTDAHWRSVKDRDMEIVRLRHREQASGGWLTATQSGGANVAGRAPSATAAAAAGIPLPTGPSPTRFMTPSPRGISRGEQAGQAVIARLSRLQAAAAGTAGPGVPGGVGVPGGMRGGVGGHIHSQQAELQMQMRRYHQAMMAVGGTAPANSVAIAGSGVGGGGQGSGGNGGRGRPCVQVAQ